MRSFSQLRDLAIQNKGSAQAVDALLPQSSVDIETLSRISDDRWLAGMTKAVFQAGFRWKVIESKWPGFEAAFHQFDPSTVANMDDQQLEALLEDKRIVRQWRKIQATRDNAVWFCQLAEEHGSAAHFFAHWPAQDFVGLLAQLKQRAQWMGGTSAQYFLRFMGCDSFILSRDVCTALQREGVISTDQPQSKQDLKAIQQAFNQWMEEGGVGLTVISRTLALGIPGKTA